MFPKETYQTWDVLDVKETKPMTVVVADFTPEVLWDAQFQPGDLMLYLGEITNTPGHVAVVDSKGKVHWGHHDFIFRVLPNDS